MSRLLNQVCALEVALDELWALGGAFLRVPTGGTQPQASQRAWLSWQLAHSGANLHQALAELDTLIAAQPGSPASSPACPVLRSVSCRAPSPCRRQCLLPQSQSGLRAPNSPLQGSRRPARPRSATGTRLPGETPFGRDQPSAPGGSQLRVPRPRLLADSLKGELTKENISSRDSDYCDCH